MPIVLLNKLFFNFPINIQYFKIIYQILKICDTITDNLILENNMYKYEEIKKLIIAENLSAIDYEIAIKKLAILLDL